MRIIAGKYRSRKLIAPQGMTTRPTSDRARESVFNVLDSLLRKQDCMWTDLTVLDVFAGTGALGIEALSRGAKALFAAEKDPAAVRCFYQNADPFIKDGVSVSLFPDALNPPPTQKTVGLVFMDPPYEKGLVTPALKALLGQGWIDDQTLCVIEIASHEKEVLPDCFEVSDSRVYGKAKVLFIKLKK